MASSNRHWPSMFKSKHCNNHHQWHLEHNPNSLLSTGCHRPPFTSGSGCEERSPEPKPRWNPKPEQIRILEAIFNSGMINPPRDEIRKIRAQLEKYGQIGDANVFYWFQNKKSRSKSKLRHPKKPSTPSPISTTSSSSSSEKPSQKVSMEMINSPSASVNNNPTNIKNQPLTEPYLFSTREILFPPDQMSGGVHEPVIDGNILLGEFLMMNDIGDNKKVDHDHDKVDHDHEKIYNSTVDATAVSSGACASVATASVPSTISHFQGVGEYLNVRPAKSTVFINDVAFLVNVGPFNVRETFGDDTVLIQSNGHPVFTNEWGVTAESLQHGGCYYLIIRVAPVNVSETLRI